MSGSWRLPRREESGGEEEDEDEDEEKRASCGSKRIEASEIYRRRIYIFLVVLQILTAFLVVAFAPLVLVLAISKVGGDQMKLVLELVIIWAVNYCS
jgi:hypothetical protein